MLESDQAELNDAELDERELAVLEELGQDDDSLVAVLTGDEVS